MRACQHQACKGLDLSLNKSIDMAVKGKKKEMELDNNSVPVATRAVVSSGIPRACTLRDGTRRF